MCKFRVLLLAVGIWLGAELSPALAEEASANIETICTVKACRTGGMALVVWLDETHLLEVPVKRAPYILENKAILIYPGETLAIQFTVSGDELTEPRFYKRFAPKMPAKLSVDGGLSDNSEDAFLPNLPEAKGKTDFSSLPTNTVVLSYGQLTKEGMTLILDSNLTRTLKVDATIFVLSPGKTGYDEGPTSTCPVRPGTSSYESWPDPMGPLIMKNLRLLPDGASMVCN